PTTPSPCSKWARRRPRPAGSASKSFHSLSGGPKISRPRSKVSRPKLTRFTLLLINSLLPTGHASSLLPLTSNCPQFSVSATLLRRERSCPTDQITQTCSHTRQILWIGFCAGRSPATYHSDSPPQSNLSSTSRPPHP